MNDDKLIDGYVALIRAFVRAFTESGHIDRARDLIAATREACDELTAEVNEARRADTPP
jgi:hypothetical protein